VDQHAPDEYENLKNKTVKALEDYLNSFYQIYKDKEDSKKFNFLKKILKKNLKFSIRKLGGKKNALQCNL